MQTKMRRWRFLSVILFSFALAASASQTTCSNAQSQTEIDARIDALIQQMSLDERVAQLQDRAPAIKRLGLPAYNWWNEGLHGAARDGYATVFPQAIGLAATWDTRLLRAVGDTVSTEARARFNPRLGQDTPRYGGLTIWSPNINIFRDPRWGRGQETYGEDPFLTASLGTAFVEGIQGSSPFYLKADATPKHFVAHSGPEAGRDSFHANASAHDLADTYLPAFHTLLTQGRAAALMCSYNAIGTTPSCANDLLQQRVRDTWGFRGYIVSDCDAVGNLTEYQHYTPDNVHGAAAALNAGTDLDCGNSYMALKQAVAQDLVSEQTINRSLHRLLLARIRLGMLDAPDCNPYNDISPAEDDTATHRARALRAAEESVVLLKNDGVLPLRAMGRRIAVIGPTADTVKVLEANYHGTASHPVTPLEGLLAVAPGTLYAQGSTLTEGLPVPGPRTAFRTGSGTDAKQGLTAEYFNAASFDGTPVLTTTVPTVDLDLDRVGPAPQVRATRYAARWTGILVPPGTGDYVLRVAIERCWDCTSHDHFRLFLNDKLVLDNDGTKPEPNQVSLHAAGTAPHRVRLELIHTGDDEGIALEWQAPAEVLLAEAVATAAKADLVVACVGLSPDLEGEALSLKLDGFNGGDRTSLELPASQVTLLAALKRLNKPVVVVLTSGSAVALNDDPYNALLATWYPGEVGGTAIANILTGHTSPSGRLPITVYRSIADLPDFSDYSMARRTYRYFRGPVLYPFGFGLSYTHFDYSAVRLSAKTITAGQSLIATVNLRNTGKLSADEVAELYLVPPQIAGSPRLTLQGLRRVTLRPEQAQTVTFTLAPNQLSFVDPSGHRAVRAGLYRLFIGGAQPTPAQLDDPGAGVSFQIVGEQAFDF